MTEINNKVILNESLNLKSKVLLLSTQSTGLFYDQNTSTSECFDFVKLTILLTEL